MTRVPSMPWFIDCPDCGVPMDPPPKPHTNGCVVGDLLEHLGRKDVEIERLRRELWSLCSAVFSKHPTHVEVLARRIADELRDSSKRVPAAESNDG